MKPSQLTEIGVNTESGLPARRSVEEENEQERGLVLTQNPNMVVQLVRGPIRQHSLAMRICVQVSIAAVHNFLINFIRELFYLIHCKCMEFSFSSISAREIYAYLR